jgi:predicted unusual protein kinase regulating ubiquinone biosynthesis (AarF/ABC1/UbiB family)
MNLWSDKRSPAVPHQRSERIQRASRRGLRLWRARQVGVSTLAPQEPSSHSVPGLLDGVSPREVLRGIQPPPPLLSHVKRSGAARAIVQQREVFRAGIAQATWRLLVWVGLAIRLFIGTLTDWILRRSTVERRAERLRLVLQRGGPTFVKIGQQLSLRIDLLPYQYAAELEKMLDQVAPFPTKQAIECIEEAIGAPLEKVFAAFDPKPIGSASMSCVYQAILHNGERVAIKVRRPGVGKLLAADMRALGWLMFLLEFFVLPPGFTDNFVDELRTMLLDELDFRMEARVQDLFRRRARKAKLDYVTAPRLYFHLSNQRVIVEEFINGVWLGDVLAAVESNDEQALAVLHENNIQPRRLAQRLLEVTRWSGFEGLLFHADLHPANVVVRPNNELVLIDFGSAGAFTNKERLNWRRLMRAQLDEDVGGMAQAAISMLEPLPPIDVDELTKRVEGIFWEHLYAYKDKHAEWWERTSAHFWISFLGLSRELQIPMNLNTIKMIRASMLVDTLALRLDRKVDQYKEFRKYLKGAGKRAYKRLAKKSRLLFRRSIYVDIEEAFNTVRGLALQVRRMADTASATTTSLIGKASYAASCLIQMTLVFTVTMVVGVSIVGVRHLLNGIDGDLWAMSLEVLHYTPYQVFLAAVVLIYGRRIAFRLLDTDDD